MQLSRIQVIGLFGKLDHDVPFFGDEHITILIGLNGIGKTLILKIIKSFFELDFSEIASIDFNEIRLSFGSDEVRIYKSYPHTTQTTLFEELINEDVELIFYYFIDGVKQDNPYTINPRFNRRSQRSRSIHYRSRERELLYDYEFQNSEMDRWIEQFVPDTIIRIDAGIWLDNRKKMRLSSLDIIERYGHLFPPEILDKFKFPSWLKKISNDTKVRFVETQRLLNKIKSEDGKYSSAINEYSREIIETIKTQRAFASDLASSLDRTYPKRIMETFGNDQDISTSTLSKELAELEEKRRSLNIVGLIETEDEYITPFLDYYQDEKIKSVLKLYIDDSNRKLEIYEDLSMRISLFLSIINGKFFNKVFKIDKEKGFVFTSLSDGKDISLAGLSSGEQHEVVLFYKLLFNTSKGTLLLIDEPEISLHISWQKKFIDDLLRVIKINPIDIIIATHSPDIISTYWDLAIQLMPGNNSSNSDITYLPE